MQPVEATGKCANIITETKETEASSFAYGTRVPGSATHSSLPFSAALLLLLLLQETLLLHPQNFLLPPCLLLLLPLLLRLSG